ncbi:MAG: hypothetical protein R6W48_09695, partial [Gaiellaceae bacterium]
MSEVAAEPGLAPADESPRRRIFRIAAWVLGTLAVLAALELVGSVVVGWFVQLWDEVTAISLCY